ncbi:MAG: hypothetical protein M0P01_01490 [Treponema sp.]|nr:hypothetical protein [Treponema sp.]
MINTYSESSLHKTLKDIYALKSGCRTEVKQNGKIYDIVDQEDNVIEIQTKNVSKLLKKSMTVLQSGKKIKIVHPVIIEKHIELYGKDGTRISRRKSPIKGSLYDIFDELTGLYSVLLDENFSLDVLEITMTELRIRTTEPVQSPNGRRRYRKNWNKTDKILNEILKTHTFCSAENYLKLIPIQCFPEFSAKELSAALKTDKTLPASAASHAHLMIWVLNKMNLIKLKETKNRSHYYCMADTMNNTLCSNHTNPK